MAAIITSRSSSRADSSHQPRLRLVSNDDPKDLAVAPASDQSAKTAVIGCLTGLSSNNSKLLYKASAAARERDGEFYAVMIDSARTRFGRAQVRTLIDDAILASHLGAKIIWLESSDTVGELLKFARRSRIGRIFVLRSRPGPFSRLFGRTVYSELLNRADGFRVDVVGFEHGK